MKAKNITSIVVALAMFSSCRKDFLELDPVSQTSVSQFYRNASDINIALMGVYDALQKPGQYGSQWKLAELRSDNTEAGGGTPEDTEIDQFRISTTSASVDAAWRDAYSGIARSNTVLNRIKPVEMDTRLKNQYIGEAKFLRALMYFNLVRIFGKVPLIVNEIVSSSEGYTYGRNEVSEVYTQIISDLKDSDENLPVSYTGNDIGRATKGAAKSLLGKVYLTIGNFPDAAARLKEVIDMNVYALLPKYADVFLPANAFNKESLFEVSFKAGGVGEGSEYVNRFFPRGDIGAQLGIGQGTDANRPTPDMLAAYERQGNAIIDQRYYASMDTGFRANNGRFTRVNFIKKYFSIPFLPFDADNNWPVLRYADVLLMYAEALNEVNNGPVPIAFTNINLVRQRAGLAPLSNNLNYQNFKLAVEKERRVELAFENHRWFDLVRYGKAVTVMNEHFKKLNVNTVMENFHVIFPVPQSQVDVNPTLIKQNTGYIF